MDRDEAVEAAAKAMWDYSCPGDPWDNEPDAVRGTVRAEARAAIVAFLRARADGLIQNFVLTDWLRAEASRLQPDSPPGKGR